jgi:hypothetical protein
MSDGKWLEKKVKELLENESKKMVFSFERLHDARAARGKFPPQTSDFMVNCIGTGGPRSIFIECKETQNLDQISIGDFPQFPKIKRKMLAGAKGILIVYHTTLKKFRLVNLDWFPLDTTVFKLKDIEFSPKSDLIWRCYTWE